MKPFTYTRASDINSAIATAASEPGAAFIAGATEPANWMKDLRVLSSLGRVPRHEDLL